MTMRRSAWRDPIRRLLRNGPAVAGIVCISLVVFGAFLTPILPLRNPTSVQLDAALQPPSRSHLMGTDALGRDQLSRTLHGLRLSLEVGVLCIVWALVLGGFLGALAGSAGGLVDALIMRVADTLLAFPGILLAIGIVSWLGRGEFQLTIAVGISFAPIFARLLRAGLLSVREADFVVAARSIGAPPARILLRHMLPNSLTPILVQVTLALGTAIITVAGLGFIGLGPDDPSIPELGAMLIDGAGLLEVAPHLVFFPGTAIVICVVGFNLLGDGLRQSLDPRWRRR